MKESNMDTTRVTSLRNVLRTLAAASLLSLLAIGDARAQSLWTHVASACAVDNGSAAQYDANAARFKVATGVALPATVVARCNVTNPQDNGLDLNWNWLEVAYRDPDGTGTGSQVRALLYRVSNATGGISLLATFDSNAFAAVGDNTAGVLVGGTLDFLHYAYYVEIQVKRSDVANDPTVSIVRLLESVV
jgi:hypothetical protein